ncbi:hypothetical protein GCM10007158_04070 [Vreelandella hamiltonii]|uniref:Transposase n=1 Tax=Halomonas johnsoniae TaxID=502832 RepID=A0ABQ2WAM4_9GAMM|nr:hypothetical protein GCM10007158_04070 [Halomonas johnsoniae]
MDVASCSSGLLIGLLELNLIEILWRQMKYAWLPLSAYLSFDNLCDEVHRLLDGYGTECAIKF